MRQSRQTRASDDFCIQSLFSNRHAIVYCGALLLSAADGISDRSCSRNATLTSSNSTRRTSSSSSRCKQLSKNTYKEATGSKRRNAQRIPVPTSRARHRFPTAPAAAERAHALHSRRYALLAAVHPSTPSAALAHCSSSLASAYLRPLIPMPGQQ